jgi:GNAT superfamily N-acetyltransferase
MNPHERRPSPPTPTNPPINASSNPGGLKLTPVTLEDGLVLVGLEPTLRIKLFSMEGDPVREILEGTRLGEIERVLGHRYEVYTFRVKGECIEATGQRFRMWCGDLAEHLRPDVIGPTRFELEEPLKHPRYADPSKIRVWVDRLLQLDEELSRVDVELSKLLAGWVQVESGDLAPADFCDRVNWLKDRIVDLVNPQELEEMDARGKVIKIFGIISKHFEFVRIPSEDVNGEPEVYALDGDVLRPIEDVLKPVVGALVKAGLVRNSVIGDLELAAYSTNRTTSWHEVNPWDKLRLANSILDLRELKLLDKSNHYFTYKLKVSISNEELKAIKEGSYDIRENAVYRSWRAHFDDDDWEYLVDSLGAWLAPHRSKLVTFIVGPTGSGKSTLLFNLVKPVEPLVATVSLRSITSYQFGLQALIGKHILAYSERGDVVLKNLDVINNIVGENDFIHVERKHKQAVRIRSLKTALFTMNDPPILHEQGGETLAAFIERLSLVFMRPPEGFKAAREYRVPPEEAFKFLLWCRARLEERGWEIRKRSFEEKLDYLTKMANTALRFLESDYIIPDPYGRVRGTELYEAYVRWCKEQGLTPMGRNNFYAAVATKYTKYEPEGVVWFKGLRLRVRESLVAQSSSKTLP